ncbi:MAG: hypothetical protein LBU98_03655 [Alistipes sp.]|jgi:hypothetical protein|nr:hypothetical protein [Alistipes sp.]
MKRQFAYLALCLLLTGACQKTNEDNRQIRLDVTETTAAPESSLSIGISYGSGEYRVQVSDPAVAEASAVVPGVGPHILRIETKAEGDAVITVTDTKSGLFARCALKVGKFVSLYIDEIVTHVDADTPEAIEAELAAAAPWAEGGGMVLAGTVGLLPDDGGTRYNVRFVDADYREVADGTLTMTQESAEWSPAFDFLPIDEPVQAMNRWVFETDGGEWEAGMFVVAAPYTRRDVPVFVHIRLYEDWTAYYKAKYPEAGVRSAARAIVSSGGRTVNE